MDAGDHILPRLLSEDAGLDAPIETRYVRVRSGAKRNHEDARMRVRSAKEEVYMFELFNNVNGAVFSNAEPATLYTAARAIYGYGETLNMEPAPFGYVPRRLARKNRRPRRELL